MEALERGGLILRTSKRTVNGDPDKRQLCDRNLIKDKRISVHGFRVSAC